VPDRFRRQSQRLCCFHADLIADVIEAASVTLMLTALDAPTEALDDQERDFVAMIREHGWFRTSVFGDEHGPGFSYTTGFWTGCKQPELIIFTLKREITHDVFWDLFRDAKAGNTLPIGQRADRVFGNSYAYAFPVAKQFYREYLGWNRWFYGGDEFPCLQIVWPDRAGLFPWEAGFDEEFVVDQPDLTEHGWAASVLP
jgi:hypothetical protein